MSEPTNESYAILGMGVIGESVYRELSTSIPDYKIFAFDRARVDVTSREQVRQILEYINPKTVIFSAGLSDVESCESDKSLARTLNTLAPALVAEECKRVQSKLVFFSTSMVYDNKRKSCSSERTKTNPINCYGKTKLEGESLIRKQTMNHLIIRLGTIFSEHNRNVLNRLITSKEKGLKVFSAEGLISPTYSDDAANAVITLLRHGAVGTFNIANKGSVPIDVFFRKALQLSKLKREVEAIPSMANDFFAPRPFNLSLSIKKFEKETGFTLRSWEDALRTAIPKIKGIES